MKSGDTKIKKRVKRGKDALDWDKAAPFFHEMFEGENSLQNRIILPNLKRLLELKKDETLLDIGCGSGFFARAFVGTTKQVFGVDASKELVEIAAKSVPEAQFVNTSADKLHFLKDNSIDKAIIVLALQNIRNAKSAIEECARVLKTGGRAVFVLNHPAFRIPKRSFWGFDERKNIQYRRVDEYMSESQVEILMKPGSDKSLKTISYHRPLQFYFKIFSKIGLVVERLEEWVSDRLSQPGPRAEAENKARREFPLFMAIVARKI
jgi:ubiquinone/menaquinone biosynthesis C-methylase UbiE